MDKFEAWLVFESNRTNRPLSNQSAAIIEETLAQYRAFKAEILKDNDDPLVAEIEKMIIDTEEYEQYTGIQVKEKLRKVSMMILARQQAEKDNMIAFLEKIKDDLPYEELNTREDAYNDGVKHACDTIIERITQGKEQERADEKE